MWYKADVKVVVLPFLISLVSVIIFSVNNVNCNLLKRIDSKCRNMNK